MSGRADEKKQESPVGADGLPVVRKLQAEGELWVVREVAAPFLDRRGGMHLVFESTYAMRRVRSFPSNWSQLGDDDLYALSCDIRQSD
jgi:hypothetical protein